jgi:CheY-like chemotaxis protein
VNAQEDVGPVGVTGPLRILVVDDHPALAEAFRHILERDGHQVAVARGGIAGVDAMRSALTESRPFDLVMADFSMPDLDGMSVAASVKEMRPSTVVILVTGYRVDPGAPPACVDAILTKPPSLAAIRAALARVAVRRLQA